MNPANLQAVFLIIILTATAAAQSKTAPVVKKESVAQTLSIARNMLNKGDAAGAISVLKRTLQDDPQNAEIKFWLGKAFYTQADYQGAIENLSLVNDKFAVNSNAEIQIVQMLGLAYYISGRLAEAIPYLEKITQRQPENSEIAYALGVSYIQTRQPAKSRDTFAKLFNVQTNSGAAYLLNAQMHVRQQFEETAATELNKALEIDPRLPQVRFILGELAIYRAEIDQGIIFLKQEIALNPLNAMAYYRLGEGFSRQLKWDEAIPPLQKSIWLNPFFSGPYIVLGKVYLKKQDFGNAENMLRRSTAIDPNNFGAHYLLAQVLQQTGKAEEAKAEFALAEKLRGNGDKAP